MKHGPDMAVDSRSVAGKDRVHAGLSTNTARAREMNAP